MYPHVLIKTYGDWSDIGCWMYEHSKALLWIVPRVIQELTDKLGQPILKEAIKVEIADCRVGDHGEDHPDLDILIFLSPDHFGPRVLTQMTQDLAEGVLPHLRDSTNVNDPFPVMRFQIYPLSESASTLRFALREPITV